MPNVNILKGIYGKDGDGRVSHPLNLVAVAEDSGLSKGHFAPVSGITWLSDQVGGLCRGMINWNGALYAVTGNRLVSIALNGTPTFIGDVGNDNVAATLMYGTDRLAVVSNGKLYYWFGASFFAVTDPDVGVPISGVWVDGYYMLTDGTLIYVSDLADPTAFNPVKYAAAESDPDPIKKLLKIRNEPYAVGRYTIEVFQNVGGSGFPFTRVYGAQVMRGTLGVATACVFMDTIAMLGSGKNEAVSVFLCSGGQSQKIATREIDLILGEYSEAILAQATVETRSDPSHQFLYIHLPNKTLMYDGAASQAAGEQVWSVLSNGTKPYPMRYPTWCYDRWNVMHSSSAKLGLLDKTINTFWGDLVDYQFNTNFVFNDNSQFSIAALELIGLYGAIKPGVQSAVMMQYSDDGEVWSRDFVVRTPLTAQRGKRLQWRSLGRVNQKRIFKFRWNSDFPFNPASLNITAEALL